jgi:predicted ferric reductase
VTVRLSPRFLLSIAALTTILGATVATIVLPPVAGASGSDLRLWLTARATGIVAYGLLTAQVALGLLLSHPTNGSTWKLSKRLFPWHENLSVFLVAFAIVHVATVVLDPFAKVDPIAAFVPGMAEYRPAAVGLGTTSLYAGLIAAVSARWTKLLPTGLWLRLHRLALLAWATAWAHGVLAGTDAMPLTAWYAVTGAFVVGLGAWRYSVVRASRRAAARATHVPSVPARRAAPVTIGLGEGIQ